MLTKVRQGTADLAKGIAVLLMIQVHLLEVFARPEIYVSWIGTTSLFLGGPPVAPVFMVILGYFLGKSGKTTVGLLLRGTVLLLIALLLNIGLNCHLLYKVFAGKAFVNPWEYVLGADILFLAGLSIFVVAVLRRALRKYYPAAIICALAVVLISNPANDSLTVNSGGRYLLAFIGGNYSWSYFPLFPWLAYPLLGFAYSNLQESDVLSKTAIQIKLGMLLSALIVLFISANFAVTTAANLPAYYHHGPLFFGWTVLFICIYFTILVDLERNLGENRVFKLVKWIGKNVLLIYIVQWLIIGNIGTAVYRTQGLGNLAVWYLAILIATCFVGLFVQSTISKLRRFVKVKGGLSA